MDIKRLPWVPYVMEDLGLEDRGGGFWTAEDGRSIYLGLGSAVIMTHVEGHGDLETQHVFPTFPSADWLLDACEEHQRVLLDRAAEEDQRFN
jgi:hypothetical protein